MFLFIDFCNTNINNFISFNNVFIFMVLEQAKILNYENQCDSDDEKIFDIPDNYFTECDPFIDGRGHVLACQILHAT